MRRLEGFQRGINLGGWLSQGPLDKHHLDTFIVEDDIKKLQAGVLTMSGCRLITRMLRQKKAVTSKRDTGISRTVFRGAVNTI